MEVVVKHYRIKQYPKYKLAKNILFILSLVQKEMFSLKEHHFICLILDFNTFSKPTCQYKRGKKKKKTTLQENIYGVLAHNRASCT